MSKDKYQRRRQPVQFLSILVSALRSGAAERFLE